MPRYDAVVVGAGPNGLAAAITFARAGRSVLLIEGKGTIGGGNRTAELTLPGFRHDICAAVHPLVAGSPFLRTLPLERFGVEWVQPDIAAAHPLDDGTAVGLYRSLAETASSIGGDGQSWTRLIGPSAADWDKLAPTVLGPHPVGADLAALIRFGLAAAMPAHLLARLFFREERARALFAGLTAHSFLSFRQPFTSAFGMLLGILAHAVGWPFSARRRAGHYRRDGHVFARAGRRHCGWLAGAVAGRTAAEPGGAVGCDAPAGFAAGGVAATGGLPAQTGEISLWSGRV